MQQNDQMPQIMAMLTKIFTKLEEHDLRFDALEKRVAAIENRLDVIEARLDAIEQWMVITDKRITRIEQKIDDLTQRVIALENRVAALETEVRRLGVLFEDNETKLQHILDVLSSYLKKMENVDHLDESMIEQTQGLQITKIALANHIQNRKIHLMPARGRPKKNLDESET